MTFGKWITNQTAAPFYARREFRVDLPIKRATVRVTGLGQFNFYINGKRVSDDLLEPGWTDYRKTVQYVEYDVTDTLQSGANAMGIEVGNGWYIMDTEPGHGYSFHFPPFMPPNPNPYVPFGGCLVAMVYLALEYADGTMEEIVSDESWRTQAHAVVWSNVYGSEYIDGARRPGKHDDWAEAGFFDADWDSAKLARGGDIPKGRLTPRIQPPIRAIRAYPAQLIGEVDGVRVYDLGQNISGILSVEVKGKAGTEVSFRTAEKLDENGLPDQMAKNWMLIDNVVTCRIAEDDVWEAFSQTFTYFAGRYIGVTGDAALRALTGTAITSAWKRAGNFSCDDERYNRIYDMIEKTVEANMLSVHTDCPTIERFAWQEPNHLMGAAIMYMKDGRDLWRKFLTDCRNAQHSASDRFFDFAGNAFCPGDGLVPSQAPCYIPNVLPVPGMGSFYDIIAWGSTIILGTRWHYLFYGDKSIIEENYAAGARYFHYLLTKRDVNGFISHGLGDWGNPEGVLARENIETALLYADAVTLQSFAEVLGKIEDAATYAAEAAHIREHYNHALLVQNAKGRWCYRCFDKRDEGIVTSQACEALPLYWGMVPEDKVADVVESLRETMEEKGAFIAGEVGLPYVIQAAAQHDMNDLIARFITRETHPSYYAFILAGETTLGEYWEDNPRSHCHDMMGHIIEWYYNSLAGIQPLAPGFAKVRIAPWMPEGMNEFHCEHETPYGVVRVQGRRVDGTAQFDIDLPEGITRIE